MRVAFVLRSTEVQLLVRRFVRDGSIDNICWIWLYLAVSPPPSNPQQGSSLETYLAHWEPTPNRTPLWALLLQSCRCSDGDGDHHSPLQLGKDVLAGSALKPTCQDVFAFFVKSRTYGSAVGHAPQYSPGNRRAHYPYLRLHLRLSTLSCPQRS